MIGLIFFPTLFPYLVQKVLSLHMSRVLQVQVSLLLRIGPCNFMQAHWIICEQVCLRCLPNEFKGLAGKMGVEESHDAFQAKAQVMLLCICTFLYYYVLCSYCRGWSTWSFYILSDIYNCFKCLISL